MERGSVWWGGGGGDIKEGTVRDSAVSKGLYFWLIWL